MFSWTNSTFLYLKSIDQNQILLKTDEHKSFRNPSKSYQDFSKFVALKLLKLSVSQTYKFISYHQKQNSIKITLELKLK